MNSVLSIFIGSRAQNLSYFLYHLESEQIYDQEDDPISHSVMFRNVEQHLPRALIYDFKNNIAALQHINNSNNRNVIEKLQQQPLQFSLDYSDLQGSINQKLKGIKPQQHMEEVNPIIKVFNNFHLQRSQCIEINKYRADPQWNVYYAGMGIADTEEKAEGYTDPLRKQLQLEDYTDGFVMWADTFCGYGVFTERMLDLLHEQCPKKPIMLSCLTDSEEVDKYSDKQMEFYRMNQFLAYSELRPRCQMFLPFDIRPQLNYFQSKDEFNVYRSAAPLASNLYTPFSYKNAMRFSNYVQSMRPFGWNNLFNAAYTVPLIHGGKPLKGYSMVDYADTKLPNDLNYLRPLTEGNASQPHYQSFSESYVLRGPVDISQFKPHTHSLDMKLIENLFANRQDQQVRFAEHYFDLYGKEANSFPFHSVLFSHELLKHDISRISTIPKKCSSSVLASYYKMGVEHDSFKQYSQLLLQLYDNYDQRAGHEQDES